MMLTVIGGLPLSEWRQRREWVESKREVGGKGQEERRERKLWSVFKINFKNVIKKIHVYY